MNGKEFVKLVSENFDGNYDRIITFANKFFKNFDVIGNHDASRFLESCRMRMKEMKAQLI